MGDPPTQTTAGARRNAFIPARWKRVWLLLNCWRRLLLIGLTVRYREVPWICKQPIGKSQWPRITRDFKWCAYGTQGDPPGCLRTSTAWLLDSPVPSCTSTASRRCLGVACMRGGSLQWPRCTVTQLCSPHIPPFIDLLSSSGNSMKIGLEALA